MTTTPTTTATPTGPHAPCAARTSRSRRHRASSSALLAASALLLAPLLAACSPGGGSDAPSSSASAGGTSSVDAQLGSCLREAGYDVDDADLHGGGVVAPPPGWDVDEYATALEGCRAELPAEQGAAEAPSADDVAAFQAAALEVAECVREKGFEDFPDPVDGEFPSQAAMSTDSGARSPQDEAFLACSDEVGPNADSSGGER